MARFRVKDLMIQVGQTTPQAAGGCWPFISCPGFSDWCPWWSPCPWYSCWCTFVTFWGARGDIVTQPADLGSLKEQLQQALTNIEAQERALEERDRPKTLEEVEMLEQQLKAALDELAARKAELGKQYGEEK